MTKLFLKNSNDKVILDENGVPLYRTLPDNYTELEYIESTGTQYIDTGIKSIKAPYIMEFKFYRNDEGNSDMTIFGQRSLGKFVNAYSTYYETVFGNTAANTQLKKTEVLMILDSQKGVFQNGSLVLSASSSSDRTSSYPGYMFAFHENEEGNPKWFLKGKLYFYKIFEQEKLTYLFIPARRESDNEIGLYDLVNNVFYTNSGTGTFTAGPNAQLPNEYQEVEFIQGTGSQYIAIPNTINCDEFELVAQYNATTSEMCIIGNQASGNANRWELFCDSSRPYYNLWTAYNSQGTTAGTISATNKAILNYKYSANQLVVTDGTNTNTINKTLNEQPRFLFQYGGGSYYAKAKVFKLIFKYKNGLISKLIPCYRKSDNVIGMYDLINDTFLINSGSGTFTKGDNV